MGDDPILTLLFAFGAFGVSNQLRGSDVILNQVSIIDFAQDGTPRQMESVVGLFSHSRGSFALEIPDGSLVIPMSNTFDPFSAQSNTGNRMRKSWKRIRSRCGALKSIRARCDSFAVQSPPPIGGLRAICVFKANAWGRL